MLKMTFQGQIFVATQGPSNLLRLIRYTKRGQMIPFCPGFDFIFDNDRKSYLGRWKFFFESNSEQH